MLFISLVLAVTTPAFAAGESADRKTCQLIEATLGDYYDRNISQAQDNFDQLGMLFDKKATRVENGLKSLNDSDKADIRRYLETWKATDPKSHFNHALAAPAIKGFTRVLSHAALMNGAKLIVRDQAGATSSFPQLPCPEGTHIGAFTFHGACVPDGSEPTFGNRRSRDELVPISQLKPPGDTIIVTMADGGVGVETCMHVRPDFYTTFARCRMTTFFIAKNGEFAKGAYSGGWEQNTIDDIEHESLEGWESRENYVRRGEGEACRELAYLRSFGDTITSPPPSKAALEQDQAKPQRESYRSYIEQRLFPEASSLK